MTRRSGITGGKWTPSLQGDKGDLFSHGPSPGLVRLVHARSAVDPPDPQGNFFAEEIKDSEQECAVRTLSGFLPIIIPVEHGLGIVVSEFFVP